MHKIVNGSILLSMVLVGYAWADLPASCFDDHGNRKKGADVNGSCSYAVRTASPAEIIEICKFKNRSKVCERDTVWAKCDDAWALDGATHKRHKVCPSLAK